MSGEFGEDFKPIKGVEHVKEDAAEKHDPFHAERSLRDTAKPEEVRKDTTQDKAVFTEGTGKAYSDWLAENRTPQENAAALEKSLLAAVEKMSKLARAGVTDVVSGGSYLANLVGDGTGEEVRKFMATVKNYIEK